MTEPITDFPGYTWPVEQWEQYYAINVEMIGGIKEADFKKQAPKAYGAIMEARATRAHEAANMANLKLLAEAVAPFSGEQLKEALAQLGRLRVNVAPLKEAMNTSDANGAMGMHAHGYVEGNDATEEAAGHKHAVKDGKVVDTEDHTHTLGG